MSKTSVETDMRDYGLSYPISKEKQTNADRIRVMNDEELAEFLVNVETHGYHDQSVSGTLDMFEWLQSEVEE